MMTLLVGPIGSGKSTYIRNVTKNDKSIIVVNDDSIVASIHGNDESMYDEQLKPLYKTIENTIITFGLSLGRDIIIDKPNLKLETRARYISLAKSLDTEVKAIIFPFLDKETHVSRRMNHSRGFSRETWEKVYDKMLLTSYPVSQNEGIKYIFYYDSINNPIQG